MPIRLPSNKPGLVVYLTAGDLDSRHPPTSPSPPSTPAQTSSSSASPSATRSPTAPSSSAPANAPSPAAPASQTSSPSPRSSRRAPCGRPRHFLLLQSHPPLRPGEVLRSRGAGRRRRRPRHRHDRRRSCRLPRRHAPPPASRPSFSPRPPAPTRASRPSPPLRGLRLRHLPHRHHRHPRLAGDDAEQLVRRLRKFTKLPIAVGFGISNPDHFAAVGEFADAAAIGSAIVRYIEQAGRKTTPVPSHDLFRVCAAAFKSLPCRPVKFSARIRLLFPIFSMPRPLCAPDDKEDHGYRNVRREIDELDRDIVRLISKRAAAARKSVRSSAPHRCPFTSPIASASFSTMCAPHNPGPLPDTELVHIYERIVDVMRALQRNELASAGNQSASPETRKEKNDRCDAGARHRRRNSESSRAHDGDRLQRPPHHRRVANHSRRRGHPRRTSMSQRFERPRRRH